MKGRDIRSGTPKEISLKEEDTAEALKPVLNQILGGIKDALEKTPPELSADLVDMGLVLTGGGALLKNIDKLISKETGSTSYNCRGSSILCCSWNRKSSRSRRNILNYVCKLRFFIDNELWIQVVRMLE